MKSRRRTGTAVSLILGVSWFCGVSLFVARACQAQETAYRPNTPAGVRVFEAAKLWPSEIAARGGKVVADGQAFSGGQALEVTPYAAEAVYFGFGPKSSPAGACIVTFRMKVSDNTRGAPAFRMAAFDDKQRVFALSQRLLTPTSFTDSNVYQDFSVPVVRRPDQTILTALVWQDKEGANCATLTVDSVTLARSPHPVGIGNVRVDRLWYRCGSTGVVTVTLANHTDKPQQALLQLTLVSDLDERSVAGRRPVSLEPNEVKDETCEFGVGDSEWGRELLASLRQGQEEIASASTVFTVADNPYKICPSYGGIFGVRDPARARNYLAPRFREGYVPVVEYFSWSPGMWADRSPKQAEWLSGQGNYRESKVGLRGFVDACHEQGIAVVTYAQTGYYGPVGFDWARQHPKWLSYDRLGRPQAWFDTGELERQRDPHPKDSSWYGTFGGGSIWVANLAADDWQAEELVKASQMFGFDGVRWDGHPIVATASTMPDANVSAAAYDYQGHPITDIKDGDALSAQINQRIDDRLSKAFPNYIFGYNWAPEFQGVVWPELMPKLWRTIVPDCYLLDEDLNTRGQAGSADPNNLWLKYANRVVRSVDWVKPYGGYHYSGAIVPGSHVFGCHMLAVLYAAGSRAAYVDPHNFDLNYSKFALRYGELLFDNTLIRAKKPAKVADVVSPRPTWWEPYVYTQSLGSTRSRTIVHVLNPPVTPYLDYKGTTPPAPQPNVAVTALAPAQGAVCGHAWILSPDAEPFVTSAVPSVSIDGVTVNVPALRVWTMVVFDWSTE